MSSFNEPIICSSCGASNTEGAFCVNCGTALSAAPEQPAVNQPVYSAPPVQQYQAPVMPPTPQYQAPPVAPAAPAEQPTIIVNNIKNYNTKWDYSPVRPWGYFGLNLLFGIPLVGLIFLLIFSFGGTKRINIRNYARSFFCSLIIAAILVILLVIFWSVIVNFVGDSFSYSFDLFPS